MIKIIQMKKWKQTHQMLDKADYFVEEIRSNIIYHNKIFPLIGMIAGQAARGMGKMGKKIGGDSTRRCIRSSFKVRCKE